MANNECHHGSNQRLEQYEAASCGVIRLHEGGSCLVRGRVRAKSDTRAASEGIMGESDGFFSRRIGPRQNCKGWTTDAAEERPAA